jgi:hypothetical protein
MTHFLARPYLLALATLLLLAATSSVHAQRRESSFSFGSLRPDGITRRVDGRSYTMLTYQGMVAKSRTVSTGVFVDIGGNNTFGNNNRYYYGTGQSFFRPYHTLYGAGFQGRVIVPSTTGNNLYASAGLGHYNLVEYERVAANYYDYYYNNSNPFYDIQRGSLYLGMTAKMSLGIEFRRKFFIEATYHRPVKAISNQRGLTGFGVSLGARL